MSITTVRNRINNWLTPRWNHLANRQETYFAANGRYFQGLWTHAAEVEQTDALDGGHAATELAAKPTDQPHNWRDFIGNALDAIPFPARMRIDVYDGPQGHGWVATLQVRYKGKVYARAQQIGPETKRQHGWELVRN